VWSRCDSYSGIVIVARHLAERAGGSVRRWNPHPPFDLYRGQEQAKAALSCWNVDRLYCFCVLRDIQYGGGKKSSATLVEREGKRALRGPRLRWECSITVGFHEVSLVRLKLAEDRINNCGHFEHDSKFRILTNKVH